MVQDKVQLDLYEPQNQILQKDVDTEISYIMEKYWGCIAMHHGFYPNNWIIIGGTINFNKDTQC